MNEEIEGLIARVDEVMKQISLFKQNHYTELQEEGKIKPLVEAKNNLIRARLEIKSLTQDEAK